MIKVNSLSGGKSSSYIAKHYPADYEVFSLVCIDDFKCAPKDKSLIQYVNGTWRDDKTTYEAIGDFAQSTPFTEEMLRESGAACGSGGCHD